MYTIARMPRRKQEGERKNFQFRMSVEETRCWIQLFDKAKAKNHYLSETDFNRILVGIQHDPSVLTEKDRMTFLGIERGKAELIGQAPSSKAHIKQVSPSNKRK